MSEEPLSASPFYLAYGLRIQSVIPLPELSVVEIGECSEPADVVVRKGSEKWPMQSAGQEHLFEIESGNTFLFWRDTGAFWVREGREIIVEPAQGVADHLLRPALLGPGLAMLLLQRGLVVLHASAVALQGAGTRERAVGFLGDSGQGKSTMATALHQRGHRALADDTLAVPVPEESAPDGWRPLVHPALPHLKLRPPSVEALGENLESLSRWHPDNDSYVIGLSDSFSFQPAPLQCLYVLEERPALGLQLLDPQAALMKLMEHAYSMRVLPDDDLADHFDQCVRLARQTPVFSLQRPKDFNRLPDVARLVEDHQASLQPGHLHLGKTTGNR